MEKVIYDGEIYFDRNDIPKEKNPTGTELIWELGELAIINSLVYFYMRTKQ